MRAIDASVLQGSELYREVILDKLARARESVLIATANVKDMQVERGGKFDSVLSLFSAAASSSACFTRSCPRAPFAPPSRSAGD